MFVRVWAVKKQRESFKKMQHIIHEYHYQCVPFINKCFVFILLNMRDLIDTHTIKNAQTHKKTFILTTNKNKYVRRALNVHYT